MKDPDSRYDYYAEQVAAVMAQQELIFDDDRQEYEQFIRGCA